MCLGLARQKRSPIQCVGEGTALYRALQPYMLKVTLGVWLVGQFSVNAHAQPPLTEGLGALS